MPCSARWSSMKPLAPGCSGVGATWSAASQSSAVQPPPNGRMLARHQAYHLVAEQAAHVQIVRGTGPVADDHVDLALLELLPVAGLARERIELDRTQGRLLPQTHHQARQEDRVEVIAGSQPEGALGRAGVEAAHVGEQHLGGAQDAGAGLDHALPGVRRHHVGTGTHQQGVARELAQPLESGRHGGLVHAQLDGGTRDTAFSHDGVEDSDEMEVYLVQKRLFSHTALRMYFICPILCRGRRLPLPSM